MWLAPTTQSHSGVHQHPALGLFVALLKANGLAESVGRVSSACDGAAM
jgi:hypothetical protein